MILFIIILQLRPNLLQKLFSLLPTFYPDNLFPRVQNQTVDYVLTEWITRRKIIWKKIFQIIPNQQTLLFGEHHIAMH